MNRSTFLLAGICASLTNACFAFFCPSNFNQIDFGMTIDQVSQLCGKPAKQETKNQEQDGPQEWVYYIPQTVATDTTNTEQGTLKTSISFDKDGKAVNISVNGIGVGSSTICGGAIALGQSRDDIKAACGEPSYINKSTNPSTTEKPKTTKITTFIYNTNPPVKLIFENDLLTNKQ